MKAEVKENSSTEETVHVDVENDVAEPEVQDRAETFKNDFEKNQNLNLRRATHLQTFKAAPEMQKLGAITI